MYGVYWEYTFATDGIVSSFLFVPEYVKKTGTKTGSPEAVPATIMYRTVSNANPQKNYRYHKKEATNAALNGTWGDPTVIAVQLLRSLDIFGDALIQSTDGNPDFKFDREPLFLEITDQELDSLLDENTPRSLTARLYRARVAAGYPELPGKD